MDPTSFDPTALVPRGSDSWPIAERAIEIVREGRRVPPGLTGRLIATFGAAWELGHDWRILADLKDRWDGLMVAWGERGGDVDWWSESDRRLVRVVALTTDPWAQAWREADIDAELAPGFKVTTGVPAKMSRLWSARAGQLRDRHPGVEEPDVLMAALNDLCRDIGEIGTHARRVRADRLRYEASRGRRPKDAA